MHEPETRASLIAKLNLPNSEEAWEDFVAVYRPLIVRVAIAKGLQHADAEDLAQETLAIVGRSIESFDPLGTGSFRGWLKTITRNLVVNHLMRQKGTRGTGNSKVQAILAQQPATDEQTATLFDLELRRSQFLLAAKKVRVQFSDATWAAFERTAIERRSIGDVAAELDKTKGAVRMARSRVMTRLREEVQRQQNEDQEN